MWLEANDVRSLRSFPTRRSSVLKDELLTYLAYGRNNCKTKLESMSDEMLTTTKTPWRALSVAEMMLYSLRHVQDRKSTRLNSSHIVISYAVFSFQTNTK